MQSTDFAQRRERLFDKMENGIAVIGSNIFMQRSNDTDFPFRQNSNFRYLTGINEPDCVLILSKKADEQKVFLFIRPNNELEEMWMGKRMGLEKSKDLIGADKTFPISDFNKEMEDLLPGHKNLYVHFHERADLFTNLQKICGDLFNKKRKNTAQPPQAILNVGQLIEELRYVKDQNEILTMKKAMVATNNAHRAAMALTAPGRSEKEVNALIEYIFTKGDGQGNAYDNIVAGGNNANILHYIENNQALNDGELLLIDAGCQLNNYATDITRTFPINGKFTGAQKAVYEIVLDSQKAAISHSWPDRNAPDMHKTTCKVLTQGLIDLKVLSGSLDENLEKGTCRKYFPHGTGHWLGLDVHDQNPYLDSNDEPMKFEPGVIFTVEPGLYFPKEDATLPEELRGIGIRIEDNILITETGHENLSAMIPKEVKEIEEACEKDYRDFLD